MPVKLLSIGWHFSDCFVPHYVLHKKKNLFILNTYSFLMCSQTEFVYVIWTFRGKQTPKVDTESRENCQFCSEDNQLRLSVNPILLVSSSKLIAVDFGHL